ncbi:MAG: conjugal transfer protein TraI [Ferruginibacter sp.]
MKKIVIMLALCVSMTIAPTQKSHAVVWVVVKAALKKVIMAIDLALQKQQNKVIWLQNAQKTLENTMSKLKLDEIADWVDKQRNLYKEYFDELQKVKSLISYYHRINEITTAQENIIKEYKRAFALFKQDGHFTAEEIIYMGQVYDGILIESAKNLDQLFLVINSFVTQMTDAKRLEIINAAATNMSCPYNDLKLFNTQNIILSLQRSKDENDINTVKALYGIQ